jgi:galactonate dehydratase
MELAITKISTCVVNAGMRNWVFVKVETNQPGLYGWGEATLEWKTRAVVGAVEDLAPLLIGRDPRDTEQNTQILHKWGFWRIGVIGTSAISGIETALWDISGKELGVPVWRLLGGKVRDKVRIYTHLGMGDMKAVYESLDAGSLVERACAVVELGYTAIKVVNIPYTHYTASLAQLKQVEAGMLALREAVGDDVEIMVDFHGRCASTSAALQYIDACAPARPLFVEEPIGPGDARSMAEIAHRCRVPIAAGERLVDRREFNELFNLRAIHIAQPDLCHVGGFGEARKIASAAEVVGVGIAPHNPLGPIAGVAALHFDIATPNFVIQEEMNGAVPWYHEVISSPIRTEGGYWMLPTTPGLGIEVNEAVARKHPFKQEEFHTVHALLADGTVVDW